MKATLLVAAGAAVAAAQPAPGPIAPLVPLADTTQVLRHCNYVASVTPPPGTDDSSFTLVAPLNGAQGAASLQSVNYPTYYLAIFNSTSGAVGIVNAPDANDASWAFQAPLSPGAPSGAYSLASMSKNAAWTGKLVYFATTNTAPCAYSPPSGDVMLVDPSVAKAAPGRASWMVGPTPPANASVWTVTPAVTNPSVNRNFMGCHHDYGFAQAPRGFFAEMLYSPVFTSGTSAVPTWATVTSPSGCTGCGTGLQSGSSFAGHASMNIAMGSGSAAGATVGVANRGLGNAGLYVQAGKPYEVNVFIWTGGATTAYVELRDFTSGVSLARQDFAVQAAGPAWGSLWFNYSLTLTPSAGTECVGIAYGSDPTIDCGNNAGPAHVCVRCGAEFVVGLSSPGSINVGHVSLMPGPWGRLHDKAGNPLPVLQSGADLLTTMGVTFMRSGGTVSQSMRWRDWVGPQWNRPSVANVWGSSLTGGWGPFEVIDMCNALDIEPAITLAYDSNDVEDWADLVEFCWGDAVTTTWGRRRAAWGHPAPYNITAFELGNEQPSPNYVDLVAAMEARAKAVGAPPLRYAYPQDALLPADLAQRALDLGLPVERFYSDLHVGAGGAVEQAASLFANEPVPGFNMNALNWETNAATHDHKRALNEAADLIDWFTAPTNTTDRLLARTASFCHGTSSQFDTWDQGIAFFLPNMTWYQPPGYVHIMITNTWAETTLAATLQQGGPSIPFAAQRTTDGKTLVLRAVSSAAQQPLTALLTGGLAAAGPSMTLWTLTGKPAQDNTPSAPTAVAPVSTTVPLTAGATNITVTLAPNTFAVLVVPLQ